jgi:hypothetical protein
MKKASEINPQGWLLGASKPKTAMLMRKWDGLRRNARHMEELLLTLMSNPATTPEQLAQAAKIYASVTQQLLNFANEIDDSIYQRPKPSSVHMLSCAAHKTGNEDLCECKDWQDQNL